jgi:hypothetical protein
MTSQTAISVMSVAEFTVWAVLAFLFWRKKLSRRFPATGAYLVLRVASAPVQLLLLSGNLSHFPQSQGLIGDFIIFWGIYVASAVLLLFVCMEILRSALSAFAGLMNLGLMIFRWAAVACGVVTFSSMSFAHKGILIIPEIAFGMMRAVSILELCLLAFLFLSMKALRLSARDMAFGMALAFGLISANDFVAASLLSHSVALTASMQLVYESVILAALVTWVTYFGLPEPSREPLLIPVNSTVYRWNEIASALGHTGTRIAVRQPASSFLMTDVENVVDRVLPKKLTGRKSES